MRAVGLVQQEAEQLQRRGIDPVQVFDDEQQRLPRCQRQQHGQHRLQGFWRCRCGVRVSAG